MTTAAGLIAGILVGFIVATLVHRRRQITREAMLAESALGGLYRVNGELMPSPSDPRWQQTHLGLAIEGAVYIRYPGEPNLVEVRSAYINGPQYKVNEYKVNAAMRRYVADVAKSTRERLVRGTGQ